MEAPALKERTSSAPVRRTAEPVTLRVNSARVSPGLLVASLEGQGFRITPVAGLPAFFRVDAEPFPISSTLEHWLGLVYIQQAVTGVAPLALGARPGERILDLCAAPGGKASHVAELMGKTGVVVAGDVSEGRLRALLGNLYRLAHTGVVVVSADGRSFPGGALFDRVLVDVPCSGEGNPRRRSGAVRFAASAAFRSHITGVQRSLLARAAELVRPGGTILYVTCTTAPEENEAVVARALARLPLTLEPIELETPHDPGLTRLAGRALPQEMELTWRLTSEHLGSGALFMARLRREEGEPLLGHIDRGWSAVPGEFPRSDEAGSARLLEDGLAHLGEQLGVPHEATRGARWLIRGGNVWMHSCAEWPVEAWGPDRTVDPTAAWQFVSMGVRAFKIESGGRLRATNDLLRSLDGSVKARVVELGPREMTKLIGTGELSLSGWSDGFVALRVYGHVVGRGFVRAGRLRSEIPRPHAALLAEVVRASEGSSGEPLQALV